MDSPATKEELMGFAARQIRTNLRQAAEIAAIKQMLVEHMAQTLAIQEQPETPEEREKLEAGFTARIEENFARLKGRYYQGFLEQVEDEWPDLAARFDERTDEEIEGLL